jgi:16S rRNA (guanine527-N7)-methyltransferase
MQNPLPNLRPVQTRAEVWNEWGRFDTVTGRAVAPLSIQLELSARLVRVGGTIVAMRTPIDKPEIERLKDVLWLELEQVVERAIPGTDVVRVFPIWRKKRLTPKGYPRTWAEIKRNPL